MTFLSTSKIVGVSFLLLGAQLTLAQAPTLKSRNMPLTCEYVYQVESDIEVSLHAPDSSFLTLVASYRDAYDSTRRNLETLHLPMTRSPDGTHTASWTLKSFEANSRKLYRQVDFWIMGIDDQTEAKRWPENENEQFTSEFGRAFGEACRGSRDLTPWVERAVSVEPIPNSR